MKDRIPTKPNRYVVYDDAHNFLRYEYHERADEPTQEGTPLNKGTLLSDATAAALAAAIGMATPETVNEALAGLAVTPVKIEAGSYTGTNTYGSANKNSLAFPFPPKMVIIVGRYTTSISFAILNTNGGIGSSSVGPGQSFAYTSINVSVSENALSWYASNAGYQQNGDKTYDYVAIG